MFENSGDRDKRPIEILLGRAIDYAGLFPPAALDMETAVRKYSEHKKRRQKWMLGRFVVPVSRLEDFNFSALELLEGGRLDAPWRLTVLAGTDLRAGVRKIRQFNEWHGEKHETGLAVIDVVEIKAHSPRIVETAARIVPDEIDAFFEIPVDKDPNDLVRSISRTGAGAKVRTGGVTPEMFPAKADLVRVIKACYEHDVVTKATAGLHHAFCGVHNLTYEPGSPSGRMYGFLNLFFAAACAREMMADGEIAEVLGEESVDAFAFDEIGVRWKGHYLSNDVLQAVRSRSVTAFGSCSFDQPVEDLKGLGLL